MSVWELYKEPASDEGKTIEGTNARYFIGREGSSKPELDSPTYIFYLGGSYLAGLASYMYCTAKSLRTQRMYSTAIITLVPFMLLCHMKGDDNTTGLVSRISLEKRLEYYPVTRRALERAIRDVSN
ncbi:hypothetical protein SteCoe_20837 [Stentor coeruleus]|uniref:Uncharacterized protein n=1 Tax=Stentor coeruleus TaxID=5963 RepID=A0A1R2BRG3_9CILI|nr:hypothetical protein SteCoe_20837 [Stentor coeruleus]